MINTMTKIGEGAFADVFGCQKEGWDKLAIKVHCSSTVRTSYPEDVGWVVSYFNKFFVDIIFCY